VRSRAVTLACAAHMCKIWPLVSLPSPHRHWPSPRPNLSNTLALPRCVSHSTFILALRLAGLRMRVPHPTAQLVARMESMFWLLGPAAGTGGPPQHRPGRPRACGSPASKTENRPRPRSVPSRYSGEDVGRRVPDLAAPFSSWARIATYNLLANAFRHLHSNPVIDTGKKRVAVKANCDYKVLYGLSSVSSFHRLEVRLDEMSDS
jgi:hypothetical protein